MTVVSMRCSECDEVKREQHMEMTQSGDNICDACSSPDVPEDVDEVDGEAENEAGVTEEKVTEESADSPTEDNEDGETTDNGERDKKPLEESFNEQDPLEW